MAIPFILGVIDDKAERRARFLEELSQCWKSMRNDPACRPLCEGLSLSMQTPDSKEASQMLLSRTILSVPFFVVVDNDLSGFEKNLLGKYLLESCLPEGSGTSWPGTLIHYTNPGGTIALQWAITASGRIRYVETATGTGAWSPRVRMAMFEKELRKTLDAVRDSLGSGAAMLHCAHFGVSFDLTAGSLFVGKSAVNAGSPGTMKYEFFLRLLQKDHNIDPVELAGRFGHSSHSLHQYKAQVIGELARLGVPKDCVKSNRSSGYYWACPPACTHRITARG